MICFKVDGARVSLLLRFHPKVGRLGFRHSHVGDCHPWSVKWNAIILRMTMTTMLMMAIILRTTTPMMILTMMIARVNAVPRYGSPRGYAASKGWLPVSIIDITIYIYNYNHHHNHIHHHQHHRFNFEHLLFICVLLRLERPAHCHPDLYLIIQVSLRSF